MNPYRSPTAKPRLSKIEIIPFERPRLNVVAVLGWLITALFMLGLLGSLTHCAGWQRTLRDVLSVTQVACIIAHQTLPDADVQKACEVVDELVPPMRTVLGEARMASVRARQEVAGQCK